MKFRNKRLVKAFTLVELLVVIAIIGVLAGLLLPAVQRARMSSLMTSQMSNGRDIYVAIYQEDSERFVLGMPSSFPNENEKKGIQADTSTDYFITLVTNGTLKIPEWSFLGGPGVDVASGTNTADFTADNNAWCATLNLRPDQDNALVPFLFTRNVDLEGELDIDPDLLNDEYPFQEKGCVLITVSGTGRKLSGNQMRRFNEPEADNPIIRPE